MPGHVWDLLSHAGSIVWGPEGADGICKKEVPIGNKAGGQAESAGCEHGSPYDLVSRVR